MDNTYIYQKVLEIHDHTMGLLRSMKVPAYPSQYKKYFDQLFIDAADEHLRKDRENVDQQGLSETKVDESKYLDMIENSVSSFMESHSAIASVAKEQRHCIDRAPLDSIEQFVSFIDELTELNQNMSAKLDNAQLKIQTLTEELQEARLGLTTDLLTKVGNRQSFNDDMASIIEAGIHKKLSLVLIMVDIDNFKFLNEEYGYVAGDKVLYSLAQLLKRMIRTADKVYRYGGEKFAVVLNRCDVTQAESMADKIRSKIEQSNFIYAGKNVYVTASVGVTIHQQGDTVERVVERADKALYCAKKSNKNCTVLFDW